MINIPCIMVQNQTFMAQGEHIDFFKDEVYILMLIVAKFGSNWFRAVPELNVWEGPELIIIREVVVQWLRHLTDY